MSGAACGYCAGTGYVGSTSAAGPGRCGMCGGCGVIRTLPPMTPAKPIPELVAELRARNWRITVQAADALSAAEADNARLRAALRPELTPEQAKNGGYPLAFRVAVVRYRLQGHTLKETGEAFGVSTASVCDWTEYSDVRAALTDGGARG